MILHAISYTKEFGYAKQFCSDLGTNAIYYPPIAMTQEDFFEIWNQYPEKQHTVGDTKVLILDKIL